MKQAFINWKPKEKSIILLHKVEIVLSKYEALGYRLTLRQLYYQLVAADIIENSVRSYARLGNLMTKARMAGYVDWNMIEDRVRRPDRNSHWSNPASIMNDAVEAYYRDKWVNQNHYIEVWSEKDAVSNIIQPVCKKWDVTFMANRGYSSITAMYDGWRRTELLGENYNKLPIVIYLGDHDPSGMDMTHDIRNRFGTFIHKDEDFLWENVRRIALNMDQIEMYQPPENPAKQSDSRYEKYVAEYGTESSWELDALDPEVLAELVENNILKYLDTDKFEAIELEETQEKEHMQTIIDENFKED